MSGERKRFTLNRSKTAATACIENLRRVVAKSNRMDIHLLDRLTACTLSLEPAGPLAGKVTNGLADECSE